MSTIYGVRSNDGEHGVVMTKREVVEFMLDVGGYHSSINLSTVRLLDPATLLRN